MPITSKLLPFRARNLAYLAEVAALTRIATGVMRVYENRPSKQTNPLVTPNEKRQALAERFFVEIFGTAGYMAFLHMGQDMVGALYDGLHNKKPLPKLIAKQGTEIDKALKSLHLEVGKFNQLIEELYHPNNQSSGVIYRVLYEDESHNAAGKFVLRPRANMAGLKKLIIRDVLKDVKKEFPQKTPAELNAQIAEDFKMVLHGCEDLKKFATKNNIWASSGILTGVIMSALVGGTLTQWMNDRLVAPTTKKWLNKKFQPLPVKAVQPALPSATPGAVNAAQNLNAVSVTPSPVALPQTPANAFNFFANNAALPPNPPPIAPVYLPNPKMQPPATAFSANTLPMPYTSPMPYSRPTFGGRP
jgi:hypothetical protein